MASTTAKGIPYPENTDAFADGADAVKALADWMEANGAKRVHAGSVVVPVTASATGTAAVVFPAGKFTAAPIVVAMCIGTSVYFATTTGGPTAAGFTAQVRHNANTSQTVNVTVHYVAIQLA